MLKTFPDRMAVQINIEGEVEIYQHRDPLIVFKMALMSMFFEEPTDVYGGRLTAMKTIKDQAEEMVLADGIDTGVKTGILIK